MKHDLTRAQSRVWKMIRNRKADVNELGITNAIDEEAWTNHFKNMYGTDSNMGMINRTIGESDNDVEIEITIQDVRTTVEKLKGRKAPGKDGITNEMLKYGGDSLQQELLKFVNVAVESQRILTEMKTSITIPIFKKGDKREPENYRGIILLSTILKLISKN